MVIHNAASKLDRRADLGVGHDRVDVHILGPVLVREGNRDMGVDRPLERAALVRLALARGVPVPDQRLAEDLWGDADLHRPIQRLRVLISRLRAALGAHGDAVTRSPAGYRTTATIADLLAAEAAAERVHAAQRAGQYAVVRSAAEETLSWWRGPTLVDLMSAPFAHVESTRLDEWRLGLNVAKLDATLYLGSGAEISTELTTLVREHPLHEPLARLSALTLYRTGSQADALDRLHRLRKALAEELGVDPTPETAELELRILRHDPSLQPPRSVQGDIFGAPNELRLPDLVRTSSDTVRPVAGDAFVGRERELAAVVGSLSQHAVVTLVGGPGSGKTRLALEAVRGVAESGRSVVFVELASLHRSDTINQAIAVAVAATPEGCPDAVNAALTGALLVLDNAEHVLGEVISIIETLRVPGLTVLVTSQRALGLPGEVLIRIGPLDHAAGLTLFGERAICPVITAEESDVAAVCAAVDWLPLGIELAAGLTKTFTIAQLAQRIDGRIRLLMGGRRTGGSDRHSSLRAALDWSYELLDPVEQAVLRRISVFAGGFVLEAAEWVVPSGRLEKTDVAPALAGLVDRGLATVLFSAGQRRFALLETVRDYALSMLAVTGEGPLARQRHVAWCLDLVRAAGEADDFGSAESIVAVFTEWPNVLEALEHAVGAPWARRGLQLATAMHTPWTARAWHQEAGRHFEALIDAAGTTAPERAHAWYSYALHLSMLGRYDESARALAAAAELADGIGDDALGLDIRYRRGKVDIARGQLGAAVATLEAGETQARRSADVVRMASFAEASGAAQLFAGLAEYGLESFRRAVQLDRERGDEQGLACGLSNRARALVALARYQEALLAADESDRYAGRLDDRRVLARNELVRAAVELAAGRLENAENHCRTAQSYLGHEISMADIDLADVLIHRGELTAAKCVLDSVYTQVAPGSLHWLAARPVSAALAVATGDTEAAAVLVGRVTGHYAKSGFGWQPYLDRLQDVQQQLAARRASIPAAPVVARTTTTLCRHLC